MAVRFPFSPILFTRKLMAAADCQPTSRFAGTTPLPPAFQDDGLSPPPAGAVPFHSYWLLAVAALLWRVRKGGSSYGSRPMNVFDLQAEAVRCPDCALVGIASLTEKSSARKIKRLPKGFKVITTDEGDQIYCAACNRPAITLIIDP